MPWKTREFVDVPAELGDAMKSVKINSHRADLTVTEKKVNVHYLEAVPPGTVSKGLAVLFLHGMAFRAKTWDDLNSLHLVAAMGYHGVAVDLPGYGESEKKDVDKAEFLETFIKHAQIERPVIVSPSMSGVYSLPFLLTRPESSHQRARAYLPVAPVTTEKWSPEQYQKCTIPVMIAHGTEDVTLGEISTKNLKNFPNHEVFPVQGGNHPFYMNHTDEWHWLLYNFLHAVDDK